MTKNILIGVLIVLLGVSGWVIYDKSKHAAAPGSGSYTSTQTDTSSNSGKTLDYSHQNLTSVGSNIYDQTGATALVLSYNDLRSLPSQLGNMNQLQVLRLDHNQLQGALIAEIRKMPLVTLDASYNQMTGVPAEIGQLNQLQTLNLSHNNINTLPNEIANLKQLKTLDFTGNPLTAGQITQLKSELPNTTIIF